MIRALVLHPDKRVVDLELDPEADQMQDLVGGDLGPVHTRLGVLWGDKARSDRRFNEVATMIAVDTIEPQDFIAGTVVLTGYVDPHGHIQPVSDKARLVVSEVLDMLGRPQKEN